MLAGIGREEVALEGCILRLQLFAQDRQQMLRDLRRVLLNRSAVSALVGFRLLSPAAEACQERAAGLAHDRFIEKSQADGPGQAAPDKEVVIVDEGVEAFFSRNGIESFGWS